MKRNKQLSKKQLAVIDELFKGELDEQTILDRHKISRRLFERWLADERFNEQFESRIASAYRQSRSLIARYAPAAAAKLVQLTECEKEETARKACLDIISLPQISAADKSIEKDEPQRETPQFSPETAGKLLAVLAKAKEQNEDI